MRTGICDRCGTEFEDWSPAQVRRWCSDNCRKRHYDDTTRMHPCVECGEPIRRPAIRCSDCHLEAAEKARTARYQRIAELWRAGVPAVDIARQVRLANANVLGVVLDVMKHAGWDVPPRRAGWTGGNPVGPPTRPLRTRQQARVRLNNAVRHGKVVRSDTCERCGVSARVQGHHHDYSRPLEVEWLCRECHQTCHSELLEAAA